MKVPFVALALLVLVTGTASAQVVQGGLGGVLGSGGIGLDVDVAVRRAALFGRVSTTFNGSVGSHTSPATWS